LPAPRPPSSSHTRQAASGSNPKASGGN
jgi:hypothetical protein